jgi:PKD repeat protein
MMFYCLSPKLMKILLIPNEKPTFYMSGSKLFSLVIFTMTSMNIFSQTYVSGDVSGKWTKEYSPYIITTGVTVMKDSTLTINPGVEVRFNLNAYLQLYNSNGLVALGLKNSPIVFTSNEQTPAPGNWGGVYISGTDKKVKLKNCIFEYAITGIYCKAGPSECISYNNYASIDSCTIRYNSDGISCYATGPSNTGCIPARVGFSSPVIEYCQIYDNQYNGIYIAAFGGSYGLGNARPKILRNVIINNGQNGIKCEGSQEVDPEIFNNNILYNKNTGIVFHDNFDSNKFKIINNLVSENNIGLQSSLNKLPDIRYNNVWSNTVTNYQGLAAHSTDISDDPLFVDPEVSNFNLQESSPCIDAGDTSIVDPDNTVSDIGALFYSHMPVADFEGDKVSGTFPLIVHFKDISVGELTSWHWIFGDGAESHEQNPVHSYAIADTFDVSLIISGKRGFDSTTKENYIQVTFPPPKAFFGSNKTAGIVPLSVQFTDFSSGDVASWLWDFGDGEASTEEDPTHIYDSAGIFTVSLWVKGKGGEDIEIRTNLITANVAAPVASFLSDNTSGEAPLELQFTDQSENDVSSWLWEFGDGSASALQHPSHKYSIPGRYNVKLTVTGAGGTDLELKNEYIKVSALYPNILSNAEFDNNFTSWSITSLPDADYLYYIDYSYYLSGRRNITFLITDGGTNQWSIMLYQLVPLIKDESYQITFHAQLTGSKTMNIALIGELNASPYTKYFTKNITLVDTLQTYGPYTVKSSITDDKARFKFHIGATDNVKLKLDAVYLINLPAAPIADFSSSRQGILIAETVSFTDHSTGNISDYLWDFGDGNTSTEQNPSHFYSEAGKYTVSLTVSGDGGSDTETKTNYITVTNSIPVAAFACNKTSGHAPLEIDFIDNSTGNILSWLWNFGDGSTSTIQNPSHSYFEAGTYTVSLTVSGDGGSDTETKTNYITVTNPTSIPESKISEGFKLYPNPSKSTCKVILPFNYSGSVNICVFNNNGTAVMSIVDKKVAGSNYEYEMDISNLSVGLYYVSLISDTFSSIQKLIITK